VKGNVRYQGKLVEWNAEKNCGFIRSRGDQELVFFSASDLVDRHHIPPVGADLAFFVEVVSPNRGRTRTNLRGRRVSEPERSVSQMTTAPPVDYRAFSIAFLIAQIGAAVVWRPVAFVLAATVFASLVNICQYGYDKSAAESGSSRIREDTLLGISLIGGWPGAAFAQRWMRHKTVKATFQNSFRIVVWLNVLATCLAAYVLATDSLPIDN
jgi:uncharacterized membrane protein YsdA (DUF1294 family)